MVNTGYLAVFIAGFALACICGGAMACWKLRKSGKKNKPLINNASNQLEELSKLTGTLAHELKNPLSIIKVNLRLLGENLEDKDIQRADRKLSVIGKEIERLEDTLGNFLNFIGDRKLQKSQADINVIIDDIVDFYSPQAWKNNIKLRFARYSDKLICNVDQSRLKQVLLNFFINAQQAINDSGEIIVSSSCEDNFAKIVITDTGKGIEREKIDKIFDAFYTSRPGGSGLGLATAKKIIEAHQGKISVESESGKGSSFTILLPLKEE